MRARMLKRVIPHVRSTIEIVMQLDRIVYYAGMSIHLEKKICRLQKQLSDLSDDIMADVLNK